MDIIVAVDEDRKYTEQRLLPSLTPRILICGPTESPRLFVTVFTDRDWGVTEVPAESGRVKNEPTDHKI